MGRRKNSFGFVNEFFLYSKAFKYLLYNKVFLFEILKQGFQTLKNSQKPTKENVIKKKILSDLV